MKKPHGVTVTPQTERNSSQSEYAERMAKEIRSKGVYTHPMGNTQPESTRILMSMPVDQPYVSTINPIAEHPEEVVRSIGFDEYMSYETMRRAEKNTMGDTISRITPEERKEKAIEAWLNTEGQEVSAFMRKSLPHIFKPEEPRSIIPDSLWAKFKKWYRKASMPKDQYQLMSKEEFNTWVTKGIKSGK